MAMAAAAEHGMASSCAGKAPSPAHTVPLVSTPLYPNAVKWSDDNLLAVAAGRFVTILNPSSLDGPRGFLAISSSAPYDIGLIQQSDLYASSLLPICLSRDGREGVRCIDWSPQGLSPNGGCLLAVCTTDHHVKLYRYACWELQSEWIEVLDLSDIIYKNYYQFRFTGTNGGTQASSDLNVISQEMGGLPIGFRTDVGKRSLQSSQEPQHRKEQKRSKEHTGGLHIGATDKDNSVNSSGCSAVKFDGEKLPPELIDALDLMKSSASEGMGSKQQAGSIAVNSTSEQTEADENYDQSSRLCIVTASSCGLLHSNEPAVQHCWKVANEGKQSCISPSVYLARSNMLSFLTVSWSPRMNVESANGGIVFGEGQDFVLIAVGTKLGEVCLLRMHYPQNYMADKACSSSEVSFLGTFEVHRAWVTILCWCKCDVEMNHAGDCGGKLFLATGSSDGSVKVWCGDIQAFGLMPPNSQQMPFSLLRQVLFGDLMPVTSLEMTVPSGAANHLLLAVGKGCGSLTAWECSISGECMREAEQHQAHSQVVTGIGWAFGGRCVYSCSQDNMLRAWLFHGGQLIPLPFPEGSGFYDSDSPDLSSELPASVLDCYFGLALSKGSLTLVAVRGIETDMVNPMYQSRSHKGVVQLFWIGGQHLSKLPRPLLNIPEANSSNLSRAELAQWESNILFSIQHFDNEKEALILWDILAALNSLKHTSGNNFIDAVISRCLVNWGFKLESWGDDVVLFTQDLQIILSSISSRRLHMINILFRQLYMSNLTPEQVSKRGLLNVANCTFTRVDEHLSFVNQSIKLSGDQGILWENFLVHVEHELRQRLVLVTLHTVAWQESNFVGHTNIKQHEISHSGVSHMVEWAVAHPSGVSSQLLVNKISETLIGNNCVELCTFCSATVPFDSIEVAHCQGSISHKLQRCAASFEICHISPLWFCICCARWAAKQTPAAFFMLSSKHCVEQLSLSCTSCNTKQPFCPFCGILMQKMLPDCFLRLALI